MIKNGYSEQITVKYSEVERNLAMKPYALLNFLQDLASVNAENLGFGYSALYPKGYAWFLIKYRMEFSDYPFDVKTYTLTTEPRGYNKLFAFREFELNYGEKCIARIFSQWAVADMKTRSIVPMGEVFTEVNSNLLPYEKHADDLNFSKIPAISIPDVEKSFEVRYNDLDVNGHANNGNYIIWAFEPLNIDFRNTHKIKTLDMLYKKEASFGETVLSQVEFPENNKTIHSLKNISGDDLCLLECEWEEM